MAEFMSLVKCKEESEPQAKGATTSLTRKDTEDVFNNLKFRGIIDEKGLVKNGRGN